MMKLIKKNQNLKAKTKRQLFAKWQSFKSIIIKPSLKVPNHSALKAKEEDNQKEEILSQPSEYEDQDRAFGIIPNDKRVSSNAKKKVYFMTQFEIKKNIEQKANLL